MLLRELRGRGLGVATAQRSQSDLLEGQDKGSVLPMLVTNPDPSLFLLIHRADSALVQSRHCA
jgi:hypothetical protein